jgi:Uma2 family endonuclease
MRAASYVDTVPVPRATRFPIELRLPHGFRPEDRSTWPMAEGRMEYVHGRLLFMPPCGGTQAIVVGSLAAVLGRWVEAHPELWFGTNEVGMVLGDEVRGADAAVWRRSQVGELTDGYLRTPPLLAAEVGGQEEGEPELREKAAWYLSHGVEIVWLVLPKTREVVVLRPVGEARVRSGDRLPEAPELPGLTPAVDGLFRQLG